MVAVGETRAGGFGVRVQHAGPGIVPPGPGEARQIDEAQWKQNCIDLHQVMSVAKSVYLVLEHSNEALVRVAVELATCPASRKILWWTDAWSGDFQKREYLKTLVKEKLALAMAHVKNTKPVFDDDEAPIVDPEEFEKIKKQLQETENAKKAAQAQQQVAELRCREVEETAAEDRRQLEAMESSLSQLRAQLRAAMENPVVDPELQEKYAELEGKLKASEQQNAMLTQKVGDMEGKLRASEEALAAAQKAMEAAQEEARRLSKTPPPPPKVIKEAPQQVVKEVIPKKLLEDHKREIQALKDQVEEAQSATNVVQDERDEALAQLEKARAEAEAARRRAEDAEAKANKGEKPTVVAKTEVRKRDAGTQASVETKEPVPDNTKQLMAELEEAQRRAREAEQLAEELAKRPPSAAPPPPPPEPVKRELTPPPVVDDGLTKEQLEELAALRRMAAEHEKVLAKLAKRDEQIAKLKEEKEILEDEKLRMLRTLAQIRDQLRRVQEIAEKKGYGKLVADIMEEAKVTDTINSPEYSCFDRLYEDALRRQRKQRDIDGARVSGERWRPQRGGYGGNRGMMGMDGEQPGIPASYSDMQPSMGPYRHRGGQQQLTNSPCLRCGFVPSSGSGYFSGAGMPAGPPVASGVSSPNAQVARVHFGDLGTGDTGGEAEGQRQALRATSMGILKDPNGQLKPPAMYPDMPAQPRLMVSSPSSPALLSPASNGSVGTVNLGFPVHRIHDAPKRNRSRSPIDIMLQQRSASGVSGQTFLRLAHSKSEPRELPRLQQMGLGEQPAAAQSYLPMVPPITGPGRLRGGMVVDRFAMVRAADRDRSSSSEKQRRGAFRPARLSKEDFVLVGGGVS